jgi:T5SS/PEP-CTERM-associated repeat protein
VTMGGNLINSSTGSFGDGGVSVGNSGMGVADRLTVDGAFTNSGLVTLTDGNEAAATAVLLVMGAFYESGIISGTGTLTVSGVTTISGGSESGGGTTVAEGGASLFDGASETFTLTDYTLQLQGNSQTAAATGDVINLNNGSQLVIENGATFTDQGSIGTAFTVDNSSGSGSLINDGAYIKTGNGQTDLETAFTNNGAIEVDAGVLIIGGTVSGSGAVMITGGGAADFLQAFHQNVTFSGAGALQLAQSTTYGGTLSGFGAGDSLDLTDIAYSSGEHLVWTQVTTGADAAGTLQIYGSSGTVEETLNLDGAYSQSDFLLGPDASSTPGTEITFGSLTVDWINASGGTWTDSANADADWSSGTIPTGADDVVIDLAGSAAYTVLIANGTSATAASLTINSANATLIDEGTLTLTGGLTVAAGTFDLASSGSVVGGTLQATGGSFAWGGGTLSGVTYDGTMNLSAIDSELFITNGLTMLGAGGTGAGTIELTGQNAELIAEGSETLSDATLNIGNSSADYIYNDDSAGVATLTLAANLTIDHVGTDAVLDTSVGGRATSEIINDGTINADLSGGNFTIQGVGSFDNQGTIAVSNGDTVVDSAASFTNSGTITFSGSGGTLQLDGAVSGGPASGINASFTGTANMVITVGPDVAIASTALYGIGAIGAGTGDLSVSTTTGDTVDTVDSGGDGSAGIVVVDQATAVPVSANGSVSSISVIANGIIKSGVAETTTGGGDGEPAGILAGYEGGASDIANSAVIGNVTVTNNANITAQAGDGIRAVNFGTGEVTVSDQPITGDVTVSDQGGTITTEPPSGQTNPIEGYGNGIYALNEGPGSITVSMSAGAAINSAASGIFADNASDDVPSTNDSEISVTAEGTINSGTIATFDGSPPAGILAGYNSADAVAGNVIVTTDADITATAGDGIRAYNFGTGDVTVNDNGGTIESLGQPDFGQSSPTDGYGNGIYAFADGGGNISVSMASTAVIDAASSGILAQADGSGDGAVTLNVGANATVSTLNASTALYGIAAFSNDTGDITVSLSAGDVVTSGSAGVAAVSFATTAPPPPPDGFIATIDVIVDGATINSGANLSADGNPPGGIVAGYNPNDTNPNDTAGYVAAVTGIVNVKTTDTTVDAAAGFGIEAFTFGSGGVTITTDADTSVTVTAASTNGNISADAGLAAFALDGGDANIDNSGTVTAATGFALQAQATTPDGDGTGTVTVMNSGSLSGGILITTDLLVTTGPDLTFLGTFENSGAGQVTEGGTTVLAGYITVTGTGALLSIGSANINLAGDAGSTAVMTVAAPPSGPVGSVDASGGIEVGYGGSGTLTVEDGAQVTAGFISIGQLSGSQGTVDISGAGTTLTVTTGEYQSINVGLDGSAALTISDQAAVTTSWIFVGMDYVASVTDKFTLSGATLNLTDGLVIGDPGTAVAFIENGAIVDAGATGYLNVGYGGTGTLTIESGASVTADFLNIGSLSGSSGTVDIIGPGTTVTTTAGQYQNIGVGFGGAASLTIADSAAVTTTSMEVAADADPGAIAMIMVESSSSLTVTDDLVIGEEGSAEAVFEGGANVTVGGLDLATQSGSTASVTINGTGTAVTASSLYLGGPATLAVTGGAILDVTGSSTGTGSVTIEGGTIDFAGTSTVPEITFNNGTGGTTYGELILGSPSGYSATISGFAGTAPSLSDSDGIELTGTWTQQSQTASGGNLVETLTNGSATVTLTFANFDGGLNIAYSDGNTLITDPPASHPTSPARSIGGLSGTEDQSATGADNNPIVGSSASGKCDAIMSADTDLANRLIAPEGSSDHDSLSAAAAAESHGKAQAGWSFNLGHDQIDFEYGKTATQSSNVTASDSQNSVEAVSEKASVSIGGSGNDQFIFNPGIGAHTIVSSQKDFIELNHFAADHTLQQLSSLMATEPHGPATIEHNDSLTIPELAPSHLQAHLEAMARLHG